MQGSLRYKRTFLTPFFSALVLLSVAPLAGAVQPTGSLSVGRTDPMAAKLPDGRVLVAGGNSTSGPSTASAEIYDPATGSFTLASPLVVARNQSGVATLADGRILIVGGVRQTTSGGEFLGSAEIYDPLSANWSMTAGSLTGSTSTTYPTTITLPDGRVLIIDGTNSQVFDPASGVFSQAIALSTRRSRAGAALLPDGRVLLAGGQDANLVLASADIWNPATGTSSATGAMVTPRTSATATPLADGRILVVGGYNNAGKQASAELFDPATQTFSPAGNLATARSGHLAVALADGDVLVAGGYTNSSVTSSLERYDAATGIWSDAGALNAARSRMFTATRLDNGNVLFAGGPNALATAEIYVAGDGNLPPVANYSHTVSNLTVTFTDASNDADGTIAARLWNFGDGTTSTAASPVKTYASAGTYSVALSVTDNSGATNTVTKSISVGPPANIPPSANFSFMTNGLTAFFTDSSSDSDGSIVSRLWNFADGTTSTATSPSKTYAAPGTYNVTLTVTDNAGATHAKALLVTVVSGGCGSGTVLCNGVAATGLSAATGATTATYTLVVPAGTSNLKFTTSGGTGDADLYVKFGAAPTISSWDCRPYNGGNVETCNIPNVQAGTYYVVLRAYAPFAGVSLTGSYTAAGPNAAPVANFSFTSSGSTVTFTDTSTDTDGAIVGRAWSFGDGTTSGAINPVKTYSATGSYVVSLTVTDDDGATHTKTLVVNVPSGGCGGTVLCNGVAVTGLSAGANATTATYTLVVPAGATNLSFVTSGGTGDADLYVKFGAAPTTSSWDCRPYMGGNAETCTIPNVQAGTYYVVLRGYSAFSGVSLQGSYSTP
jgi:PKD repeat protein